VLAAVSIGWQELPSWKSWQVVVVDEEVVTSCSTPKKGRKKGAGRKEPTAE
jgi:hypothetical protein